MARFEMPKAPDGARIGLLGGSFDPAHAGHAHITREALKRFGLDAIWWLVTPGNPLKAKGPAPLAQRMTRAREVMQHPRVEVTDLERVLGTRYTAETLDELCRRLPRVRFVWLMGADNLAQFHLWERWSEIAATVPIGVLARPGEGIKARTSRTAQAFRDYQVRKQDAYGLASYLAPAWAFVNVPMRDESSTEIRQRGDWTY